MNDQGKVDEAEGFYKRALSLQPRNADAYNNYAVFLGKMGENWHTNCWFFPLESRILKLRFRIPHCLGIPHRGRSMSWATFLFVLWLEVAIFFRLEARNFQSYTENRNWGGKIQKVNKWRYTCTGRAVKKYEANKKIKLSWIPIEGAFNNYTDALFRKTYSNIKKPVPSHAYRANRTIMQRYDKAFSSLRLRLDGERVTLLGVLPFKEGQMIGPHLFTGGVLSLELPLLISISTRRRLYKWCERNNNPLVENLTLFLDLLHGNWVNPPRRVTLPSR